MSIWVRAFIRKPIGKLDVDAIRKMVVPRLELMTSLLCPDDEEPAEDVLGRLKIERTDDNRLTVGYRKAGTRKMQLQRWTTESKTTEVEEELAKLPRGAGPDVVRKALKSTVESVGIELKLSDANSMGLPLSVAIAAGLAAQFDGIIHIEDRGWFEPQKNELKPIAFVKD